MSSLPHVVGRPPVTALRTQILTLGSSGKVPYPLKHMDPMESQYQLLVKSAGSDPNSAQNNSPVRLLCIHRLLLLGRKAQVAICLIT